MSAPLLGVDKELKKKVPPPRATSGMPIFSWDFNKGCVNIELIKNCTGVPFFKQTLLMSDSHNTKKSISPYNSFYMEHGDI